MMQRSLRGGRLGLVLGASGLAVSPALAQPLVTLFAEDFEGFPLTVNQEEGATDSMGGVITGNDQGCFLEAFLGDGTQCGAANMNFACGNPPVPATIDCGSFVNTAFDGEWSHDGGNGTWQQTFGEPDPFTVTGQSPAPVGVGCAEWQGWSVADVDFWMNADFQNRELFDRGQGRVAVADPDEWDDYDPFGIPPAGSGAFNTTLTSPAIDLTGVDPNSVIVSFDSSWRPEDTQAARLSVSYDGGATYENLLVWSSDPNSPDFKPDSENEGVQVNVDNPTGGTMILQWAMFDAANDWWWAIDNIQVAGVGGNPILPPSPFDLNAEMFNENTTPAIDWSLSINATSYDVIFANDENFTDIALETNTTELNFTPMGGDLQAGIYFLKVVARNNIGTFENTATIALDNACPPDLDGNGVLDIFDFLTFQDLFVTGCP